MGSTESGAGDFSVGSIVWVRRRNGSWWPGKIVGPEELSSSHLTSPRSGTPVKLLGREDASVDWYNLEKSKRVKAFRCGEFDDCIEKAESSQGMPVKKREKYARREDAILHALELEKQLLKKQGKLGITSECMNSKLSGSVKKGLVSESLGNDNVKLGNSKSLKFSKRLDMSDEIIGSPLPSHRAKEGNQLSGEDDHSEVIPRMRGLQDFGLKIAPSKRKHSSYVASNGSWKPTVDGTVQALAHGGLSMGGTSHVNGKHSFEQRRRSREGLSDEFLVRRPDKRRPLFQVLQNSAKLAVPQSLQPDSATVSTSVSGVEQAGAICKAKRSKCVYLPAESGESLEYEAAPSSHLEISDSPVGTRPHSESLIEENTSGFTEDESDSSETESSESASDSSETEPDMDEEMPLLSEPEVGRYEAQEHGSMVGVEPDESTHSGDMSHLYTHDPLFASEAVSKWQLKGKRNIRNLTKRSMDATDGKGYFYGPYSEEKPEMIGQDDGCSLMSRAASKSRNSVGQSMIDWEDGTWEDRSAWNEYWDIKRDRFHPVYDGRYHYRRRPRYLIDVDLKVQASYQKEPVPIVSLMSKLNGKAIIGHPIQIEALEDGSSNTLLSTIDDFGDEAIDNDGTTTLPHAWRTARRTANVRVPRPHLLSAFDGDEAANDIPFLDEGRPPFKKLNIGSSSHKASQVKRNLPHNSRLPSDRKISKKVPKKVSLSSSQKTRTLSSLAIEQNFSNKPIHHDSSSCQRDGLIKPESSGPTTVACIPVKLVFSRLLEKINRPPSKAVSKAVLLNSDVERNS